MTENDRQGYGERIVVRLQLGSEFEDTAMRAWLFQDHRQKQRLGEKAPWVVGWIDPDGKRRSKRIGSKSQAEKFRRKVEGELAAGTYELSKHQSWQGLRDQLKTALFPKLKSDNVRCISTALDHFQRVCKPKRLDAIKTATVDKYIATRLTERGLRKSETVSPATVNRELRYLRRTFRKARAWGMLTRLPEFEILDEFDEHPRFCELDHFEAIYAACDEASKPKLSNIDPANWWKAFLVFIWLTGWRRCEPLRLCWEDVDLAAGEAVVRRHKGRRDDRVPLHPMIIDHLECIKGFDRCVFPWAESTKMLNDEFYRIQKSAGIKLECREKHEHSPCCQDYGSHDLRRAFATLNAAKLSAEALRGLMRHRSYTTTQKYINLAHQMNGVTDIL